MLMRSEKPVLNGLRLESCSLTQPARLVAASRICSNSAWLWENAIARLGATAVNMQRCPSDPQRASAAATEECAASGRHPQHARKTDPAFACRGSRILRQLACAASMCRPLMSPIRLGSEIRRGRAPLRRCGAGQERHRRLLGVSIGETPLLEKRTAPMEGRGRSRGLGRYGELLVRDSATISRPPRTLVDFSIGA